MRLQLLGLVLAAVTCASVAEASTMTGRMFKFDRNRHGSDGAEWTGTTPDPSSLMLVGGAMVGLAVVMRRNPMR